MPKIYITQSLLEADINDGVNDVLKALPVAKAAIYEYAGNKDSAMDPIASFCKDAAELLYVTELRHKNDLDAFVESAEPILKRAFREGDAPVNAANGLGNKRSGEANPALEWDGTGWIHKETLGREQEKSARVIHVDAIRQVIYKQLIFAILPQVLTSLATRHFATIDEINDALAQEVAANLGVGVATGGILGISLIAAIYYFLKNRSEITHAIDCGSICTYYLANKKCESDPDGKVTAEQIVQCFPSDPSSHPCPPSYAKKMPYCRFRKSDSSCTMLFPDERPNADDDQPALEKVDGIMEGLTKPPVFFHRADWSSEYFFRNKFAMVLF